MNDSDAKVVALLKRVVFGIEREVEIGRQLESAILERFPDADDDVRFEQLLHILASYNPAGGDYLYNKSQLADECRRVLSLLTQ
jgi:hypothetical protein